MTNTSRHNNQDTSWNWQGEKYGLLKDPRHDGLLNEIPTNQEDFSLLMDKRTPIKDCGDLPYHVNNKKLDYSKEDTEECGVPSSKTKRRRILKFDSEARDSTLNCVETSCTFFTSNMSKNPVSNDLLEASQGVSGFSEGMDASNCYGMKPAFEGWLEQYLNDMQVILDGDDIIFPSLSDIHIEDSEFCSDKPQQEANVSPKEVKQNSSNIIFKELSTASYLLTPTKIASSITYPFGFIKPSEAHGDVTLMDINQRICTPPPSKHFDEETSAFYPKSALTGKPVVKQTHIRTEGGKGFITIRRTKG